MPSKRDPLDLNNLRQRYEAGESGVTLARQSGIALATLYRRLRHAGVAMRTNEEAVPNRIEVDVVSIAARYAGGESIASISRSVGLNRHGVASRLRKAGVKLRDNGEANRVSATRLSPDARRRMGIVAPNRPTVDVAALAMCKPAPGKGAIVRASRRSCKIGKGEAELFDLLVARGLAVQAQTPVYGYNLDLSVGTVAVEVWWNTTYPFRVARNLRRTVDLADLGWSTIFVWCSRINPTAECADAVVAFVEECGRRPNAVRPEYRVVRSGGELLSCGKAELDEIALVSPTCYRPQPGE